MTELAQLELPMLLARMFVARTDVKAVQDSAGAYRPDRSRWTRRDFRDHVAGTKTFGHYVCDQDSNTKVIVFDIDFEKEGLWVEHPDVSQSPADITEANAWYDQHVQLHQSNPRGDWTNRRHPGRQYYKTCLRTMVEMISSAVQKQLEIPVVSAYSGNKGAHVYGLLGELTPAAEARAGALLALEYAATAFSNTDKFVATRGSNFYKHTSEDIRLGLQNLSVEIFPKQESMDGKDLGNLVRLPLGVNLKNPKDPCFFIDQRAPHTELVPHPDPHALLVSGNPWKD